MNKNTIGTIIITIVVTLVLVEFFLIKTHLSYNQKQFSINDLGGYDPEQVRFFV